jgi:hypothetical protein
MISPLMLKVNNPQEEWAEDTLPLGQVAKHRHYTPESRGLPQTLALRHTEFPLASSYPVKQLR